MNEGEMETLILVAGTINEKAQWMTDYSQVCVSVLCGGVMV